MAIGHTGYLPLLLHLISTGHDQELHVPCHLGVRVGHDVLLEGGIQPSEHSLNVSPCGWVVRVQVYQCLMQVGMLYLQTYILRFHFNIKEETRRSFDAT